ncbi:MAG: hypothetical protein ACJAZO_003843 [Myxococcota bacterium]|jgi:hypothetical protein
MYVTQVRTEGLRQGVDLRDLDRSVSLKAGEAGAVVADALMLWAGTLAPTTLPKRLVDLGAASAEDVVECTIDKGWLEGVGCDLGGELIAMLAPGERRFAIEVTIQADPPFFGRLREHAVRDPRLVTALGEASTVTVRVGWFLSEDGSSTTVGLLALLVGRTSFPVTGSERPVWAPAVLASVGKRFSRTGRVESLGEMGARLLAIATGSDAERRRSLSRASKALSKAPFYIGALELVSVGKEVVPAFGPDLIRARRLGPAAIHSLALVEQVFVEQPDVLIVDGAGAGFRRPNAVRKWVEGQTDGEDATLEQVFFTDGGRP